MKIKISLIYFFLGFCFLNSLYGQTSHETITQEFFKQYALDPLKAFDFAFSTNKWMDRNQDAVDNLKNQYANLLPLIGQYHGYDLLVEKDIGGHLKLQSFFLRYDRQPIRLTFVLYKPNDRWQVQNLKYDDNLPEELEESAKQDRNER
ncbi:MAG: hypothetical protein OER83_06305 [Flavobacteriaceae bacterium]|nr:hypothetical protein [Flavobacteriaceae bacterium]MDH3796466.1 hypothetical protein [Flavobacteriaceae bacterium]